MYVMDEEQHSVEVHAVEHEKEKEMLDLINTIDNEDERRKEVISDCFGISSMFVDYLKKNGYYFPDSISVNTVHKRYKDGLGGVEFTINFDLQKTCLV